MQEWFGQNNIDEHPFNLCEEGFYEVVMKLFKFRMYHKVNVFIELLCIRASNNIVGDLTLL